HPFFTTGPAHSRGRRWRCQKELFIRTGNNSAPRCTYVQGTTQVTAKMNAPKRRARAARSAARSAAGSDRVVAAPPDAIEGVDRLPRPRDAEIRHRCVAERREAARVGAALDEIVRRGRAVH